jgi:2-dehydropantoate 2-reductase
MVKDMLSPDFANNANNEVVQLRSDLLKFLNQNDHAIRIKNIQ